MSCLEAIIKVFIFHRLLHSATTSIIIFCCKFFSVAVHSNPSRIEQIALVLAFALVKFIIHRLHNYGALFALSLLPKSRNNCAPNKNLIFVNFNLFYLII